MNRINDEDVRRCGGDNDSNWSQSIKSVTTMRSAVNVFDSPEREFFLFLFNIPF